ncbi:MAG: hypothetical protein ACXVBZ_12415 [Flavisolibacter sp.]
MEGTKRTSSLVPGRFSFTSISFLVGLLLFLLPFVEIRCNGETFATNTGIGLALGVDYKTTSQEKSIDNPFNGKSERKIVEKEKGKLYVFALIAFILGLTGLILSLTNTSSNKILVFAGSLAALCLVILFIQIQMDVKQKPTGRDDNVLGNTVRVAAVFTAWYYLSVISFIVAAALSYRQAPGLTSGGAD